MHTPNITCKNCGHHFHGRFCNECGEKVYTNKDKSMMHIIEEVFHFITHFDGSLLTTIKTFFRHPGKMSADYAGGIRKRYFKPVSFFLLLVIGYLLFPRSHGINMQFSVYVSGEYNYAWFARPIARQKMQTQHITETELRARYDKNSPAFAKVCLFLLIPLSAILLAILFYSSKKYFFDHFVLATEINSFYIVFGFLLLPILYFIAGHIMPGILYIFDDTTPLFDGGRLVYLVIMIAILIGFIYMAFRNFYKQAAWLTAVKSIVFLFVFGFGIRYVYSLILYFLVMLFV